MTILVIILAVCPDVEVHYIEVGCEGLLLGVQQVHVVSQVVVCCNTRTAPKLGVTICILIQSAV